VAQGNGSDLLWPDPVGPQPTRLAERAAGDGQSNDRSGEVDRVPKEIRWEGGSRPSPLPSAFTEEGSARVRGVIAATHLNGGQSCISDPGRSGKLRLTSASSPAKTYGE
jgi:hypothetical protein